MTLFESEIRKLNIPKCVMDDIVSLRNICMEAEQQQQQPQQQNQQSAQPQQQAATPQQNTNQAQPQQNTQPQQPAQQGQEGQQPAQDNGQQQPQQQNQQATQTQGNQKVPENINENQVDSDKLMKFFDKFLNKCQSDVKARLIKEFGENANNIISEVERYVKADAPMDFNETIRPWLVKDGKNPTQQVVDAVRQRLQKYFGVKFSEDNSKQESKPEQKQAPQENTENKGEQQESKQ